MVDTDGAGGEEKVSQAEHCVGGVQEDVVHPVGLIEEQPVLHHVGVDNTPVEDSHEYGETARDDLNGPVDLHQQFQ